MIRQIFMETKQRRSKARTLRKVFHLLVLTAALSSSVALRAQTNTFPASGNVGIGFPMSLSQVN